MQQLPVYIPVVFSLTVVLAVWLGYRSLNKSNVFMLLVSLWVAGQSMLALGGYYTLSYSLPPRFILLILPPLLLILALFSSRRGRVYMDRIDPKRLTLLHLVRVPVELVLYWLFLNKAVPEVITFEGRNFDILVGLSAPLIYYFGYVKPVLNKKVLLFWNIVGVGLLLNVVIHGTLSAPTPFQQLAFDQPNIAVLHFPYALLPGLIVPMVLFSHLVVIGQLMNSFQTRPVPVEKTQNKVRRSKRDRRRGAAV